VQLKDGTKILKHVERCFKPLEKKRANENRREENELQETLLVVECIIKFNPSNEGLR
jgi:hypothetical protein